MGEPAPDSVETLGLLEQARQGDRRAFDELFLRYRQGLHEFVKHRLDQRMQGRVDASDVVQETQLEVFRRLEDFLQRQPMPFHIWLRKTAYERLLMLRRRHVLAARRSAGREESLPERSSLFLARRLLSGGSTPSERLGRQEVIRRVQQILTQLSEADREILLMRALEELSYDEVACILGIDPAAARKRHGRALLRLHKLLAAGGLTESQL